MYFKTVRALSVDLGGFPPSCHVFPHYRTPSNVNGDHGHDFVARVIFSYYCCVLRYEQIVFIDLANSCLQGSAANYGTERGEHDLLEDVEAFNDHGKVVAGVHENFLGVRFNDPTLCKVRKNSAWGGKGVRFHQPQYYFRFYVHFLGDFSKSVTKS